MSSRDRFGVVVHTLLVRDQKVYLLKRAPEVSFGGLWGLPGGHLEKGESLTDAASRECLEEVGVHVPDPQLLGVMSYRSRSREDELSQGLNFIFLSRDFDGEPKVCEPTQFTAGEFASVEGLPGDCVRWLPDALGLLNPETQIAQARPMLIEYVWD